MKKITILSTICLCLLLTSSCNQNTVIKRDLPIEIVSLKEAGKFDTVLMIQSQTKVYQFTKTNDYLGSYAKESNDFSGGMFLGILVTIVFGVLIYALLND